MTTPSNDDGADAERVNLGKEPEPAFDPYRYGRPDHPIAPEYAPPGYVPDQPAAPPPPGVYPSAPYGQAPYGQYPQQYPHQHPGQYPQQYGQPYPPPPGGPYQPVNTGSNGKAVTAMVLGIASIVLCWLSFFAIVVIAPALVFGFLALAESKRRGGTGRGMAIAGIACAVVGAVLATLLTVAIFDAADKCGGFDNSDDSGFQQCVRDNFLS